MKNLCSLLFVIFGVSLNRQALCQSSDCNLITFNSPLHLLKDYLFCDYDAEISPTASYKNATVVVFGLYINQFEVNEFMSTVDFHVLVRMTWQDTRLSWISTHFNDIKSLGIMSYEIWTPDIVMHSVTNMGLDMEMPTVECSVDSEGIIFCVPATVYTTFCEADHTWWPYNTMNCTIHVASWAHSDNEIDLHPANFQSEGQLSVDVYDKNSEWEIEHVSRKERVVDSKYGLGFASNLLSYHIILKRHSSIYGTVYVTMAMVLTTMTLMTLWLESTSTERMIVANFNFLLHLFCLFDLHWKLPNNGARPPELILFFGNSLVLATVSLILTSILRHVQELTIEAPIWISTVTVSILKSRLGRVLLVSILDPKVSARMEVNSDDNTNLVSQDKRNSSWTYISILIGWMAFLIVLLLYVIMLFVSLPSNASDSILSRNT